jgi:uncharacterized damage-inducible protein DinB
MPEVWLRGPIAGVEPPLTPAAQALLQAREEIDAAVLGLSNAQLSVQPGGAASVSFHLRHIAGSIDRLLTYSRAQALSDAQRATLAAEERPVDDSESAATLSQQAGEAIDRAVIALKTADPAVLFDARGVGRANLPSTVFGLLYHVSEHTLRHAGQIVTTAKIVRGLGL